MTGNYPDVLVPQIPQRLDEFSYPATDAVEVVQGTSGYQIHRIVTADTNVATNHSLAPNGSTAVSTATGYVWAKNGAFGASDGTWVQQHA